ncbi:MAG TPA: hypothetical protein VGF63_02105 [Solirubrobacteraceae bacterium]|jgi:hypothetical protein
MLRSVVRRPPPAAILALLALVVIAAPLANAAQDAVQSPKAARAAKAKAKKKKSTVVAHAKFADNAQKVRGYSVGFAALPSRIVLTGPNGKLPAAVIPSGTGQQGVPGPQGPKGSGFSQVRIVPATGSGASGTADATAACAPDEKVTGGGYEIVAPTSTGQGGAEERGSVDVTQDKPVVVDPNAGTSGWYAQIVRVPAEVDLTANGSGGYNATPHTATTQEKVASIKVWAVCAK